jgi:hypothetical protein
MPAKPIQPAMLFEFISTSHSEMSSVRREPTLPTRLTALKHSHVVSVDAITPQDA